MLKIYLISLIALSLIGLGCNSHTPTEIKESNLTPSSKTLDSIISPALDSKPSPSEIIRAKSSFAEAINFAKPAMDDTYNETDYGTTLLFVWASNKLTWEDVNHKDETSIPLVMKDSESTRGLHYCVSGRIIQISAIISQNGSVGLMQDNSLRLVKFYAAGSSGLLVDRSPARFCGVVTGKFTYSNSGGGTGHAIKLVGMFDLPENKN